MTMNRMKDLNWTEICKDKQTNTQLLKKNSSFVVHNANTRQIVNWKFYMECLVQSGRLSKAEADCLPFDWGKFKKFVEFTYKSAIRSYNVNYEFDHDTFQNNDADVNRDNTDLFNKMNGGFIPTSDALNRTDQDALDRSIGLNHLSNVEVNSTNNKLDGNTTPSAMLNQLKNMTVKQAKAILKMDETLLTEQQVSCAKQVIEADTASKKQNKSVKKKIDLSQA